MTAHREELAARWADAVIATGGLPMPAEDVTGLLRRLTERLAAALVAEPFHPDAGREVGAELVGARLTGPKTIGASVTVLAGLPDALAADQGVPAGENAEACMYTLRMPVLLGDVVTGYAAALRACTLEDLEQAEQTGRPTRRDPELAKRQSADRLSAVFAGLDTAIAVCAPDGRLLEVNPTFVELLRHRPAYLRTHTVFDLVHPDDAAVLRRVVEEDLLRAGHRRVRTEVRLRRRSGALIPAKLSIGLVRNTDGRPAYLVLAGGGAPPPPTPPHGIRAQTATRTIVDLTGRVLVDGR